MSRIFKQIDDWVWVSYISDHNKSKGAFYPMRLRADEHDWGCNGKFAWGVESAGTEDRRNQGRQLAYAMTRYYCGAGGYIDPALRLTELVRTEVICYLPDGFEVEGDDFFRVLKVLEEWIETGNTPDNRELMLKKGGI